VRYIYDYKIYNYVDSMALYVLFHIVNMISLLYDSWSIDYEFVDV
jgi:hypothetical protein